jgi:hypothetical protein
MPAPVMCHDVCRIAVGAMAPPTSDIGALLWEPPRSRAARSRAANRASARETAASRLPARAALPSSAYDRSR